MWEGAGCPVYQCPEVGPVVSKDQSEIWIGHNWPITVKLDWQLERGSKPGWQDMDDHTMTKRHTYGIKKFIFKGTVLQKFLLSQKYICTLNEWGHSFSNILTMM